MRKEIIINAVADEIRIAITEDKRLAELYVETPEKERMVGDIYLGKIAKVMPGIRAAFIDLGLNQDAFLHFSDIGSSLHEYSALIGDEDSDVDTDEDSDEEETALPTLVEEKSSFGVQPAVETLPPGQGRNRDRDGGGGPGPSHDRSRERERGGQRGPQRQSRNDGRSSPAPDLKRGQDIVVQVTKEPVGKKGVRVTSEVSLPGRFLVLLPFDGKIGVSKRMTNFREKRRLRRIVRSMLPEGFGVIIRTVAQDKDEGSLRQDLESLLASWREIEKGMKTQQAPALLYKDMATTSSVIRDLFTDAVDRVVMDSPKLYKDIRAYVNQVSPQMIEKIELYREREPIFDAFKVEKEIATCLNRKVWLKSGGYIIIEQTEAMVVVDVNSGRYAAKREQEQNSLRTNLEASREICRQIRLRDLGGIIVIDFIDLQDERNRKRIYDELRKEFRKDRAKVTVLPMTEIGLAQITRQRIRQSILHSFSEPCPVCGGGGMIQSKSSIVNQIDRWVRRFKAESSEIRLKLSVHPSVAAYLREGMIGRLTRMQWRYRVRIRLEQDQKLPIAEFRFHSPKQNRDVTEQYSS
ncbi:MAG: Rne/Rng family ribonuclease [Ignavibacteria bacterium]|nr:MAG: Rne/Rng family ribonuclease [Ignavibacteria bacterium]